MAQDDIWKGVGYVIASDYRLKIILSLENGPLTPREASREIGSHMGHASRALRELVTKGLVSCVNPEARKGRLYSLSKLGRDVLVEIQKRQGRSKE